MLSLNKPFNKRTVAKSNRPTLQLKPCAMRFLFSQIAMGIVLVARSISFTPLTKAKVRHRPV